MTQEANNSSVKVEIFGQTFHLPSTDPEDSTDPGQVRKIAEYVIKRISESTDKYPHLANWADGASCTRVAILTAFNIAEELHRLKRELDDCSRSQAASPSKKPFTEEARQRVRERRQRHYTKRTHERQLLEIANDESVPAKERRKATFALGQLKGYYRRPQTKR